MAAPVLQFKRGLLANLPGLRVGEPGFTTDSYDLYVGVDSSFANNKFFGSHRYWTKETTTTGSGVNFVEGTSNGSQYVTLKSPDTLSGITTFTLPGSDGTNGQVLTTNGSGTLSFTTLSSSLSIAGDSGTDTLTVGTDTLTFAGTAKEVNTTVTNNQVQIGLPDDVEIANNFRVAGVSTFVGAVTFQGGTITLGDATTDNVVFTADINSNIIPNTDATYDLGNGTQRWRNANFSGIVTASTFSGSFSGNASSADQVKTVTASDTNATYYLTFVDANNGSATNETVYTDDGVYYNPGTNTFTTQNALFTNNVTVNGTITGTATTATRAQLIDTANTTNNSNYFVTFVDTLAGQSSENLRVGIGLSVNPATGNVGIASVLSVGSASETNSYIKAGGGSNAMYLFSNGDVSFQAKVITNSIRSSSDSNNAISLSNRDVTLENNVKIVGVTTLGTGVGVTQFSSSVSTGSSTSSVPTSSAVIDYVGTQIGNVDLTLGLNADTGGPSTVNTSQTLTINGTTNEVNTSVSGQTITVGLPDSVTVTTALTTPTVNATNLKANDGTTAITINNTSGNVATNADLTVGGNLYVNGSTTQVNTASMTVEDRTIELGVVDGNTPSSSTTWDLGVLFNYNDGSAKKSALVWEQSDARFKLGSVVSDGGGTGTTNPQITFTTYAPLEIGGLWVNDCAGQSQVINCAGGIRTLENITIDGGAF